MEVKEKNKITASSAIVWIPVLQDIANLLSKVEHHYFVDRYKKILHINFLNTSYLPKFGITRRQFSSVRIKVDAMIKSNIENRNNHIETLAEKIKQLKSSVDRIKKPHKKLMRQHYIQNLEEQLKNLKYDKKNKIHRITFGTNDLFRKQFNLEANGYSSHEEWKKDWDAIRASVIYSIGSHDETHGNSTCQINQDLTCLKYRVPDALIEKYGKYIQIPVDFPYNKEHIQHALDIKDSITYTFKHHLDGTAYVHAAVDPIPIEIQTSFKNGGLGCDFNDNHITSHLVNGDGNPIGKELRFSLNLKGKRSNQSDDIMGKKCKEIALLALENKVPVFIEDLEFHQTKMKMMKYGKKYRKMLSALAYAKYAKAQKSICQKLGVECIEVKAAYTSIIGKANWADVLGKSTHAGAAIVQARRGLGFSEKPKQHLTTILPVLEKVGNRKEKQELLYWKAFRKRASEATSGKTMRELVFRRYSPPENTATILTTAVKSRNASREMAFARRPPRKGKPYEDVEHTTQ